MGEFCQETGDTWTKLLLLPAAVLILMALVAIVRNRWIYLVTGVAVAFLILSVFTVPYLVLEADCSPRQIAENEAWDDLNQQGRSPHDCQTFN